MTTFPHGFLWGAATAGHQVEGGQRQRRHLAARVGDGLRLRRAVGRRLRPLPPLPRGHRRPCADLGLNAYRFSLEWSRIEPEPGYFSLAELDHYRRVVETCLEPGVTPVVTYNHFTLPRWIAGAGVVRPARTSPARFAGFAGRATEHLGDLLSWVCTLNEPNVMAMLHEHRCPPDGCGRAWHRRPAPAASADGGRLGGFDPSRYRMGLIGAHVERMATAHRLAVQDDQGGPGHQTGRLDARPGRLPAGPRRRRALRRGAPDRRRRTGWPFPATTTSSACRPTRATCIGPDGTVPPPGRDADHADRLGGVPRRARDTRSAWPPSTPGVPVLVTENGMATDDDEARLAYTRAALEGLAGASPTASTCAVTCTGPCSTTSSGRPGSPRPSGWWPSTVRRSPARSSRPHAGWGRWPPATPSTETGGSCRFSWGG